MQRSGGPAQRLPLRLRDLHARTAVGTSVPITVPVAAAPGSRWAAGEPYAGRPSPHRWLVDVVVGAGFTVGAGPAADPGRGTLTVTAVAARSLADTVGPDMRLLVCGLNPSLVAADAGYGFAGPTNRFWRAAVAAGAVTTERDPLRALERDGLGMTDQVKRATRAAAELDPSEYRTGIGRLERLVAWLAPGAVCFVGLAGWRAGGHPGARPGRQRETLGGRPVYVMPSTSGLNARCSLGALTDHLGAALALADTG